MRSAYTHVAYASLSDFSVWGGSGLIIQIVARFYITEGLIINIHRYEIKKHAMLSFVI